MPSPALGDDTSEGSHPSQGAGVEGGIFPHPLP